jgi:hypothetical protein
MANVPQTQPVDPTQQFGRKYALIVSTSSGLALDLSELRIRFSVKQSTAETPNAANIRVYNVSDATAIQVKSQYKQVILQAGYEGNYGVIFKGNIKQVIIGRETGTDTFIDIIAGDGDLAYNYAIVNTSLVAGSAQQDVVNACAGSMAALGVTIGANSQVPTTQKLPRGKALFGNARNYLRDTAQTTQNGWSIQNGQIVFVPNKSYLPGTAVVINSQTGMIGTPQQTNEGVNVKCFINPKIRISGRVQLDNKTIQRLQVNLTLTPGSATNTAAPLPSNGIYFVLAIQHNGDTRGVDWYTTLICLYVDSTTVFVNSVGNTP